MDTTASDLLGQESYKIGGMGGLMSDLQCMRKGDGIRGRGEAPDDVVETGSSGENLRFILEDIFAVAREKR